MARLYRPSIMRYLDPKSGKRVPKGTPGARKSKTKSKTWRGQYRDADGILQSESLYTDKEASSVKLTELVRKSKRIAAGLVDPFEAHASRPLVEHVADFIGTLKDSGRKREHWQ